MTSSLDSISPQSTNADPQAAYMLATLEKLEQSQWWAAEQHLATQYNMLRPLLTHAARTVPFYRKRFKAAGVNPGLLLNRKSWSKIPLLTRRDIQEAGELLVSKEPPSDHGYVIQTSTSGSTGQPVHVKSTTFNSLLWRIFTIREHLWHKRDFSGKLASIRQFNEGVATPPEGSTADGWGPATNALFRTGPCAMLSILATVREQAEWLIRQDSDYLLNYPSNLLALTHYFEDNGLTLPRLRQVLTISETVSPALREACQRVWGVPVVDTYSSREMGYIASQCPEHENLHVHAENVLVEVLDEDNRPCRPGQIGKLVITSLHNYAMPLIRYQIGDYAEVGEICPCGRGLPVLTRILGRKRNMLRLPNGEVRWPIVGGPIPKHLNLPPRQYQLVQKSLEVIEVRVASTRHFSDEETVLLTAAFKKALGHDFEIRWVCIDQFPQNPSGKFEEFISEISG
jgi:phenylacetate-CoA ligase